MHFTYLVKFIGQKTPEKQSIDVSFNIGKRRGFIFISTFAPSFLSNEGGFSIRIQHTARSWGVDLESLLVGHLSTLRKLEGSKFRRFASKYSIRIEQFISMLFLISAMFGLLTQIHLKGAQALGAASRHLALLNIDEKAAENYNIILRQFTGGLLQDEIVLIIIFTIVVFFALYFPS